MCSSGRHQWARVQHSRCMNCKKIMENQRKKENRSKGRKEGKESSKEEGTKSQCDI